MRIRNYAFSAVVVFDPDMSSFYRFRILSIHGAVKLGCFIPVGHCSEKLVVSFLVGMVQLSYVVSFLVGMVPLS